MARRSMVDGRPAASAHGAEGGGKASPRPPWGRSTRAATVSFRPCQYRSWPLNY